MPDRCALCGAPDTRCFGVCVQCWPKSRLSTILAALRPKVKRKSNNGLSSERRAFLHRQALERLQREKDADARQEQRRAAILASVQSQGEARHG